MSTTLKPFEENVMSKRSHNAFNHLTAKLFNWNSHPLEGVYRWRDPQLQVGKII